MGAWGCQHGLLAAPVLTIAQAWRWGEGVRRSEPLLPQKLLSLCCLKQFQDCCLHLLALSCSFSCCWGRLVLGLAVLLAHLWGAWGMQVGWGSAAENLLHLLLWRGGSALAVQAQGGQQ